MTVIPRHLRKSTRTPMGAAVGALPRWLVEHPDAPKPVRDAVAALDSANAEGRVLDAARRDADAAARAAETTAERERLQDEAGTAERTVRAHIPKAYDLAVAVEEAMYEHHEALRALTARVAVEAHDRAAEALAALDEALDVRETAYARLGRPGSVMALPTDWRRNGAVSSTAAKARQDIREIASGFPRDAVEGVARGQEYDEDPRTVERVRAAHRRG